MDHPKFIYGTAWKEEDTQRCVNDALVAGFRAIDTANQRKHYCEEAVGEAIQAAIKSSLVKRHDLFLQSKYTFSGGQDHRLPYDPKESITKQVHDSFNSSLAHLQTDYLDSYLLHGPSSSRGLTELDWEAWTAIENLKSSGKVKNIGISNVDLDQLAELTVGATLKPEFVQNRCYAQLRWDKDIRDFCVENNLAYQGFSLLTANLSHFQDERFIEVMEKNLLSPAQLVFAFARQIGIIPLTGTSNPHHMAKDLYVLEVKLSEKHMEIIENIAVAS